ncbi:CdaR family protein [Lactobacillus taiwanensis]|uniref:CdaR family protein n=1 Tax=Lactobacillus taiwanensis TaxID=508451 RepID=UPI0025AA0FD6|nr:CdaR family protein [Lactobacillus taiwanensis]
MKKFFDKPWFYRIVALILAILLAVYVSSNQQGYVIQGRREDTLKTATKTQVIKAPLQVSINTDKYYVTGYPEKINLTLEGSNALVTSTINTQNFRVYIDLSHLKTGEHIVPIKVNGLSNQLTYSISPSKVHVNIQKRKSRTLPVQIEYNKSAVSHGYNLGTAKSEPEVVNITGAKSEVNQVDRVVARASLPKGIDSTFEREEMLIALDKEGHQLNVAIDPATAHIIIPINLSKKKVKVNVTSKNESSTHVYSLTAQKETVEIYGDDNTLKKITSIPLKVDLSGVNHDITKNVVVKLPKDVVKVSPSVIPVHIKVTDTTTKKE